MKIALLGAESTGKSALSQALAQDLRARGHRVTVVAEWLRTWCERAGRTPRPDEQHGIAQAHAALLDQAACAQGPQDIVIADTTPLMVAVYSVLLFGDHSLLPFALEHQRSYDHSLLMGLDLPWVADGMMRDGPQVRAPVDRLVREVLAEGNVAFQVVYGADRERVQAALAAVDRGARSDVPAPAPAMHCGRCGSGDCEHALFTRLLRERRY